MKITTTNYKDKLNQKIFKLLFEKSDDAICYKKITKLLIATMLQSK
jgi:hypothetical protein